MRCTETERAFVAYLAITGREHPREHLAELFWPERSADQSLGNLRVLLSRLRKKLDPHLEVERRTVALSEASVDVDLARLRGALQELESEPGPGSHDAESTFAELVGPRTPLLAADPPLPDHPRLNDWLDDERAVLARQVDAARLLLIDLFRGRGDVAAAVEQSAARVAADVLDEARCREHMELLAGSGQRSDALSCYEACRSALAEELDLEPEPETAKLAQRLRQPKPLPDAGTHAQARGSSRLEARARALLLERMERFWIQRVLDPALRGVDALRLRELDRPDLVAAPWSHVDPPPFRARVREGSLLEQFRERGGALLIVAEPGGGKTIRLLELAREALGEARADADAAVPVVLHLGAWPDRRGNLDDTGVVLPPTEESERTDLETWVLEELNQRYHVPLGVTETWSRHGRLLLLLDGLDELSLRDRRSFARALRRYRQEAGLGSVAVCCRRAACEELVEEAGPIALDAAVELQPLTPVQVAEALTGVLGDAKTGLESSASGGWRSLFSNPLMLSLATDAISDDEPSDPSEPADGPAGELQQHVVAGFVDRMMRRAGDDAVRLTRQLSALAQGMKRSGKGVLQIDALQPSWLPASARAAYLVASRTACGLAIGVVMAAMVWVAGAGMRPLVVIAASSVVAGPALAAVDGWRMGRCRGTAPSVQHRSALALVFVAALVAVNVALARGLGLPGDYGPVVSSLSFVVLMIARRRRLGWQTDVEPVAALAWSLKRALVGTILGVFWGGLFGASMYVALGPEGPGGLTLSALLGAALGPALAGSIIGAVAKGLHEVPSTDLEHANAGVRGSLRSASLGAVVMLLSLVVGLFVALEVVLPSLHQFEIRAFFGLRHQGIAAGRPVVVVAAILLSGLAFLWYGGLEVLEHWTLRILLWRRGGLPLRLAPLLSRAAELGLLRHQATGTIFRHRALLDHFAEARRKKPGRDVPPGQTHSEDGVEV